MEQKTEKKRHLLAVLLEDYFHVDAFDNLIPQGHWNRFESRFESNTLAALDLLDRYDAKVTFFSLGWVAEKCPEIVREITRRGHEIACYSTLSLEQTTRTQFRDEIRRSRDHIEFATQSKVLGFRAAQRWHIQNALWALELLAEEGFSYDASLVPNNELISACPEKRFAHELKVADKTIWEFPVSTASLFGYHVPIAGGNFFRQFPHTLIKRAVRKWHEQYDAPFVMYFHVWELDHEQPRISSASPLAKIRHYRNLGKMSWIIEDYLSKYEFSSFAHYLNLSTKLYTAALPVPTPVPATPARPTITATARPEVTVVIPCYNEESSLSYLANTLQGVDEELSLTYRTNFLFVDDCSTDNTPAMLKSLFGTRPNVTIVRHEKNRGVAASILTGIHSAKTEIVCSMDCDCTYDPHELKNLIPLLTENVSMVTASPYHADGKVLNVPAWRLTLSRGSSFLYRQVLHQKLATYTSCFRAYRKSRVEGLELKEEGFLGVAEILGKMDLMGEQVVEYPTTLAVRLFGYSKMKLIKTILGHLKLLSRLLALRISTPDMAKRYARQRNLQVPGTMTK